MPATNCLQTPVNYLTSEIPQAIDTALRHTSLLGERVERGQLLGSRAQKDDFGGHGGRAEVELVMA